MPPGETAGERVVRVAPVEIPLELDNRSLSLLELLEALQFKRTWSDVSPTAEAA